MYFKANCKIPIDVTFVSLRTAALSAAGTCSIEATFTTDDFSREFSSAEHPGYSVQSRPGQQGRELPSTNMVWVVREVGDFAFPRVGVWESLVPVSAQSPPSSGYVFWVQCSSPLPGLSQTLPASMMILLTPLIPWVPQKSMFLSYYGLHEINRSGVHTEIMTMDYLRITVINSKLYCEQVQHSDSVYFQNKHKGNTDFHCPVYVLWKAGTALSQLDVRVAFICTQRL